jgi:hypothetical protein
VIENVNDAVCATSAATTRRTCSLMSSSVTVSGAAAPAGSCSTVQGMMKWEEEASISVVHELTSGGAGAARPAQTTRAEAFVGAREADAHRGIHLRKRDPPAVSDGFTAKRRARVLSVSAQE